MSNLGARWARSLLLAGQCATLSWTSVPYAARYFGVNSDASLVHLQFGFLLAVAMLCRDRLPLRVCMAALLVLWLITARHEPPTTWLFGIAGALAGYGLLSRGVRWMGWPRRGGGAFGVADMSGFVVFGLGALPLGFGLINVALELAFVRPLPDWAVLGNDMVQVILARFFGGLILTLPLVVLGTRAGRPSHWWRAGLSWPVLVVGVLVPVGLLGLASLWPTRDSGLLTILLDNRLLVAALLVWMALHLELRWSMPTLVMVQLLFAAALARHASRSVWLPDVVQLARTMVECTMLQLLVLLVMLYDQERARAARRHLRDSLTEPLTGLPNLAALRRDCAAGPLPPLGFLLLDRAEKVSAGLGLPAQAALLGWVASRLRGLAAVYYLGSGQLILRLPPGGGTDAWDTLLRRLHEEEFAWRGHRMRVLPYLGVVGRCDGRTDGRELEERLHLASRAALEARQRGELHWVEGVPGQEPGAAALSGHQQALRVGNAVLSRIRHGEVELYFQPIVPLRRAAPAPLSGEVLCRVRDEDGRILQPGQFLPGLQEDRRMAELDLAVLRRLADWIAEHRAGLPAIGHLSVNVAGQSLASREFARELLQLVDRFPLPARQLCIEVTETAAILYTQESVRLFQSLRERGCRLALDDFGVGYQSFERLRQLPMDLIKIDGSFVRHMLRSPRELELVRASVAVARAFEAQTAAEYVGDAATAARLAELGVDWIQGDYVGRTAPIGEVLLAADVRGLDRETSGCGS